MTPQMDSTEVQRVAFAAALKEAREAAGLTGPEVADALRGRGYSTRSQSLYQWEKAQGTPRTREVLEALDEIVGADGRLVAILVGTNIEDRVASLEQTMRETQEAISEIRRLLAARRGSPPKQR